MCELLETIMLLCFGFSWPVSLLKNLRAKSAKSTSVAFMCLILVGYLAGIAAKLEENLTAVANDPWTILTAGALKNGMTAAEYVVLDQLVAKLESTTEAPAVKNPLKAAEASVQKNMSMFDVTVNMVLQVVDAKADSAELVTFGTETVVLTLAENATAQEILAEIKASGIVAKAQAAWGDAGHSAVGRADQGL